MTEVIVSETNYRIVIDDGTVVTVPSNQISVVSVATQGPPGVDGATTASYTHSQSSPSTTWTINHNLGFKPSIELLTVGGSEFDAEIVHLSDNQAIVYLVSSTAGTARCN